MLATTGAILKPVTGILDFVKEFVDGYIDYFSPKEYNWID